ncbi:MAG TPA: Gfo/Idh/MocA family oxidoreductase [Bryobacteraceae bacterium]|nr:Gfo/Idh/MocA family oxidoreductase [Bryobacteraceae bacterium]
MKIGMVGLGFMGAVHLSAYSKIPDAQVIAVCTQSERALSGDLNAAGGNLNRDLGKFDFSGVKQYRHWRELVLDPDLEIVDICLPTDLHTAVSIAALAAGKHVLCEKPMALTSADCDRMLAAAQENKRILMIAQVLRFWPEYVALRDFVEAGQFGAVRSATFTRQCGLPDWSKWLPVTARSGGAVIDLLVHDIDQAISLFGMPQRVAAKQLGEVDALTATLLYANGPEVRIQGGWFLPGAPLHMSFQVRTERAEMELTPDGLMLNDQTGERKKVEVSGDGYEAEISYFIGCVRQGKPPQRCLPQDSARSVKVALLLKQSREMGGEQLKCSD